MKPTPAELHEAFLYNPVSGLLAWRKSHCGVVAGQEAGYRRPRGNRAVNFRGKCCAVSRIAWCMMTGSWPQHEIDHKDGDPANNRWSNLREATHQQNCFNRRLVVNSATGLRGVRKRGRRWESRICLNGSLKTLGSFNTADEAHAAYIVASRVHFGEFARINCQDK